ncbi:S9 family peptidase [Brevundimonas naejangsanensis]|uniref:S9 family peptidase n=1 Tax=Brevundimonas naejangsanensis TaxID=588932 RepID=A0A494RHH2_9CAUL|nr:S9 family peptidase [Brevundimonas naejangsanensis]AYG95821.1 S9 family peptidase [Brevundimonas naejangsanensis]
MNRRELIASTAAVGVVAASPAFARPTTGVSMSLPQPPVAKKVPVRIEQLGRVRVDDYQWMKDDNWQAVLRDPSLIKADVKEHLTAENAYREAMMASTLPLQTAMFEEMKGRIKEDDSSVPAADGAWEYYVRYNTGDQHPLYCRRPRGRSDGETILLDCNKLAEGKAYSEVSATEYSPDHALFAYAEDAQGSEVFKIYVKDLATGEVLPNPIESATENFTFSPDSQWIFWTNRDDNGRPDKIFRRPARGGETSLVYEETDDGMFQSVGRTSDDAFIVIGIANQETSEGRIISGATPTATPVVVEPRHVGRLYELDHWGDRWVIRTNADDAVDFKVVEAPTDAPAKSNWKDLIPHTPGRFIERVALVKDYLGRQERADANTKIVIRDRAGAEHEIAADEPAYALSLGGASEFDTTVMRYGYNSPSTPTSTYDYDLKTRERTLRKVQEIPSGHNPADYVVERLNAPASDGELVPVTVLRRKDTPVDGSAPLLLYGYGSYGIPMAAGFSTNRLSLVDRGFIYAIAHIRGGSDKGWNWFLTARRFTKKNTFTDFIAAADHLIARNYTKAGNIVAEGRSAGGLLMGAVTNMRPDLWAGVIGGVPFVDVINTMSDTSLPLTPPEWPEWGNPLEDAAAYDYMLSYSPYDQIEAKPYPAVLATGGLSDPRVTYWEPEKWVAKLRPASTSGKPVLLKINMEAGHFASSGRFDYLKDIAHDYAFAVWAVEKGWEKA